MSQNPQQAQVPASLLALLREFVHEQTGIFFSDENTALLVSKLSTVMRESGCSGFLDYYHLLREQADGGPEMQRMISAITVGETWFFREMTQLNALLSTVIPGIHAQRDTLVDPIRIWSTSCATGEEPLTLAMLIDSTHPEWFSRINILATDINMTAIARAKSGLFRERSFRNIPPGIRERYFQPVAGADSIDPALLAQVSFHQGNLLDPDTACLGGLFDCILCRNVLIYFDERSTFAAMRNFARVLRPGGHLLLGCSESLLRYSLPWKLEEIDGAFFYSPHDSEAALSREQA